MNNFDINNKGNHLPTNTIRTSPRKKRRKFFYFLLLLIILGTLGYGAAGILSKTNQVFTNKKSVFYRVGKLLIGDDKKLIGEEQGTINILLLGMGGPGHEGPYLTDTMIVASIDIKTKDVVLTSVPRDFWVAIPKYGSAKINAAYAYAYSENPSSAGDAAIAAAEKVTGLDIPYYASIDFKGFIKAVNRVGGLNITIDRAFTDSTYPDYRYGYLPPVNFKQGTEHMNGERALVFARSRKGSNGEGTDFARSERQKKIMIAMKDEVGSLNISDVGKLNGLLSDFTENFRTNLEPHELIRLSTIIKDISQDNVNSFSLEPQGNIICNAYIDPVTGKQVPVTPTPTSTITPTATPTPKAEVTPTDETPKTTEPAIVRVYVVLPCSGKTLEDVHELVKTGPLIAKLTKEKAVIEVQNSTGRAYALETWRQLQTSGVNIKFVTYKGSLPYDQTIIYDNSSGQKPKTLEYLKSTYKFTPSDVPFSASSADFVIILGKDILIP